MKAAQVHVGGDEAGGGADGHGAIAPNSFHVPGVPPVVQTHPMNPPAVGEIASAMSPCDQVPVVGAPLLRTIFLNNPPVSFPCVRSLKLTAPVAALI